MFSGKKEGNLAPLKDTESREPKLGRVRGMVIPNVQADELEAVSDFIAQNTTNDEIVFTYPELGTYSFLIDRPFLGRFPIATFSWFHPRWHKELMIDLQEKKPRFIIVQKEFSSQWKMVYLTPSENRTKYEAVLKFIYAHYRLKLTAPKSYIYELKD